jgi:hypothetical protein
MAWKRRKISIMVSRSTGFGAFRRAGSGAMAEFALLLRRERSFGSGIGALYPEVGTRQGSLSPIGAARTTRFLK